MSLMRPGCGVFRGITLQNRVSPNSVASPPTLPLRQNHLHRLQPHLPEPRLLRPHNQLRLKRRAALPPASFLSPGRCPFRRLISPLTPGPQTIPTHAGTFKEQAKTSQTLFESPLISFVYERGWRQGERSRPPIPSPPPPSDPTLSAHEPLLLADTHPQASPGPGSRVPTLSLRFLPSTSSQPAGCVFATHPPSPLSPHVTPLRRLTCPPRVRQGVLLDVSCGSGLFTRRFAASGQFRHVVASDYSEAMLGQARRADTADWSTHPLPGHTDTGWEASGASSSSSGAYTRCCAIPPAARVPLRSAGRHERRPVSPPARHPPLHPQTKAFIDERRPPLQNYSLVRADVARLPFPTARL